MDDEYWLAVQQTFEIFAAERLEITSGEPSGRDNVLKVFGGWLRAHGLPHIPAYWVRGLIDEAPYRVRDREFPAVAAALAARTVANPNSRTPLNVLGVICARYAAKHGLPVPRRSAVASHARAVGYVVTEDEIVLGIKITKEMP